MVHAPLSFARLEFIVGSFALAFDLLQLCIKFTIKVQRVTMYSEKNSRIDVTWIDYGDKAWVSKVFQQLEKKAINASRTNRTPLARLQYMVLEGEARQDRIRRGGRWIS